eukprot:9497766-Pyramimonas_sp.AAC.2
MPWEGRAPQRADAFESRWSRRPRDDGLFSGQGCFTAVSWRGRLRSLFLAGRTARSNTDAVNRPLLHRCARLGECAVWERSI